eukprot:scaffold161191_cov42-Attheya_sp.AAC.1
MQREKAWHRDPNRDNKKRETHRLKERPSHPSVAMAVIAQSRSVTVGARIPSINDLTESTQLKPYCRPGCSVKKRGTETQIEITRRETHGLEKSPSQPSVATSAQRPAVVPDTA